VLIKDPRHPESYLEMTVQDGTFKMDASVRFVSMIEIYALAAVMICLKILIWKRIKRSKRPKLYMTILLTVLGLLGILFYMV